MELDICNSNKHVFIGDMANLLGRYKTLVWLNTHSTDRGIQMTDQIKIMGDCPERVALDLALKIEYETKSEARQQNVARDEAYWLGLYARCLRAVRFPSKVGQPE